MATKSKSTKSKKVIVRGTKSATLGFVDAMVERKRKSGKTDDAGLVAYREALAAKHGITLPAPKAAPRARKAA